MEEPEKKMGNPLMDYLLSIGRPFTPEESALYMKSLLEGATPTGKNIRDYFDEDGTDTR